MIEKFTVENYRSYQKEEVLSFVASNKEKSSSLPPQWYKEIDGKKILRDRGGQVSVSRWHEDASRTA